MVVGCAGVDNVKVKSEDEIGTNGFDRGCAFQRILCTGCDTHVGQIYRTTFPLIDFATNAYSFYQDRLISYEVGTGQFAHSQGVNSIADFMERLANTENNVSFIQGELQEVKSLMLKVQEVVLGVSEKVFGEPLEGTMSADLKRNVQAGQQMQDPESSKDRKQNPGNHQQESISSSKVIRRTMTSKHKGNNEGEDGKNSRKSTSAKATTSKTQSSPSSSLSSLTSPRQKNGKRKQIQPELIGPPRKK